MSIKNQFDNLKYKANVEKERKNESKYFQQFTDLLNVKKGIIMSKAAEEDQSKIEDYASEMKVIKKLLSAERNAIVGGFVVGATAFLSLKTFPRIVIGLLGKNSRLQQRDLVAKNAPNAFLKRAGGYLMETTLGFWAGWQGYHLGLSKQTQDMVDEVTKVPLCPGRSVLSDELCDDLNNLIHREIPKEFWSNLEEVEEGLKKEELWRNIFTFCDNCSKRKACENQIRTNNINTAFQSSDIPSIPEPGVPEDILHNPVKSGHP